LEETERKRERNESEKEVHEEGRRKKERNGWRKIEQDASLLMMHYTREVSRWCAPVYVRTSCVGCSHGMEVEGPACLLT